MAKNKLTTCSACGKEISKGLKKCIHCGHKQGSFFSRHKILTGFLGVIVLVIVIAVATGGKGKSDDEGGSTATNSTESSSKKPESKVNYDNFLSLNMGISYEEVVAILGEGEETSSTSIGDITAKTYEWRGKGISALTAGFNNNSLILKGQAGLDDIKADISMEKYEAVTNGMTYEQVKEILGEGSVLSVSKILDTEAVLYTYSNKDASVATLSFTNNSLSSKTQVGLK